MSDDTTNEIREDDAEGHKHRFKGVEDADTALEDDAEGHRRSHSRIEDADTAVDDAEGHRYVPRDERVPIGETPAPVDEDAEGHKRYRRIEDADTSVDDAEGHGRRTP